MLTSGSEHEVGSKPHPALPLLQISTRPLQQGLLVYNWACKRRRSTIVWPGHPRVSQLGVIAANMDATRCAPYAASAICRPIITNTTTSLLQTNVIAAAATSTSQDPTLQVKNTTSQKMPPKSHQASAPKLPALTDHPSPSND